MENLLNKEAVNRVSEFIKKFDDKLDIIVLDTTARTAEDAANSLNFKLEQLLKVYYSKLMKVF